MAFNFSAILTACSVVDDSDDDVDAPATISTTNYKDLSIAAIEATKRAIDSTSTTRPESFGRFSQYLYKAASSKSTINLNRQAISDVSEYLCAYSGSALYDDGQALYTFNDCINDTYTGTGAPTSIINGSSVRTSQTNTNTYNNFSISAKGRSMTLDGSVTCSYIDGMKVCDESNLSIIFGTSNTNFNSDIDGRYYNFNGSVEVNENQDGSFNIGASVIDPDNGSVSILATNVTIGNCSNNLPDNGTITITGAGDITATILLIDCTQFSFTNDNTGEHVAFLWSNI